MSIIAAITSTADLASVGGGGYITTSGYIYENVAEGIETSSSFDHLLPSKTADFWISCYLRKSGNSNSNGFLILYDTTYSATQGLFALAQTGTNTGIYRVMYWNGSAWTAVSGETFTLNNGILYRIDWHVKIANAGGVIELYVNGALVVTGSIDDTRITDTVTGIDKVRFGNFASGLNSCQWSAMLFADEDTRAMFMAQRLPTGNGANTAWTGEFGDLDERGIIDSDYITSTTAGAKETFTHAALPAAWATGFSVKAVAVSYRVSAGQNSGVVTKDLQRIGGTDYVGTSLGNNAQITPVQKVYNQSPATSADWTMSEAASEFGVIVEAAA